MLRKTNDETARASVNQNMEGNYHVIIITFGSKQSKVFARTLRKKRLKVGEGVGQKRGLRKTTIEYLCNDVVGLLHFANNFRWADGDNNRTDTDNRQM